MNKKRKRHDDLVQAIMQHCRLYDGVYGEVHFGCDGIAGKMDVLAIRDEGRTATIYEAKGRHTFKGYLHAREQLYKARRFLQECEGIERINLVYVAPGNTQQVRP